jgi:hypothetical protein
MQIWQSNSLELEASGLKLLDDFIREHPLCFLIGAIYLLLALLAGILGGALRRKGGNPRTTFGQRLSFTCRNGRRRHLKHLIHFRHIGNHRIAIAMTIITIATPASERRARSLQATVSPRRRSLLSNELASLFFRRVSEQ